MKKICNKKSDALVCEMNEAVNNYNANHKRTITTDNRVSIARIILGKPVKMLSKFGRKCHNHRFANPTGVPILCFMKRASSDKTVIIGIETGKADIVSNSLLSVRNKNMESFSLRGIRYKVMNFVNGVPRFTAIRHKSDEKVIDFSICEA